MSGGLSDAERRDWLKLARTENVGPVTFDQLLQRFGTATQALAALPGLAARGGRSSLRIAGDAQVDRELVDGAALGAQLIAACEPAFPQALAALDPPPLIWARGRVELLDRPSVAIVGRLRRRPALRPRPRRRARTGRPCHRLGPGPRHRRGGA